MSSLQSTVVSVQALKVHFESKEDTQKKVKNNLSSSRSAETTQVVTEEAEKVKKKKKEILQQFIFHVLTTINSFKQ